MRSEDTPNDSVMSSMRSSSDSFTTDSWKIWSPYLSVLPNRPWYTFWQLYLASVKIPNSWGKGERGFTFRDTKSFNFQASDRRQAEAASTDTLIASSADRKQQSCRAGKWYLDRRQARGRNGKSHQHSSDANFTCT